MNSLPGQAGQVALVPGSHSWVTFLICKITGSHCGHEVVITGDDECVSAEPHGVRLRRLNEFGTMIPSELVLKPEQVEQIVAFARAQVGKPYAYADDALIAIERVFRFRFPMFVRREFQKDGQWQCAQLSQAALLAGGVSLVPASVYGDVYPGTFESAFEACGWYTKQFFASFKLSWHK